MKAGKNKLVYFMTAFLALLCIVMLVLFAEYLRLLNLNFQNTRSIPYASLKIVGSDDEYTLTADNVLPSLIAVRSEGGIPEAAVNNTPVVSELYGELCPLIAAVMQLPGEPESEYTAEDFISLDNYVYLKYDDALPYQIVGAYASRKSGAGENPEFGSPVISVREIFIIPSDGGTGVFVIDGSGVLYDFSSADELYTTGDVADLLTVYGTVMTEFDFAGNIFKLSGSPAVNIGKSLPVVTGAVIAESVSYTNITGMLISQTPENLNSVLRMFNFNPDKLAGYTENDGTDVYVETHGVMRISDSSVVYSAAGGGGLSLSFFGEMYSASDHNVYDILIATDTLIGKLRAVNRHIIGGDGTVKLASVASKEGRFGGTALTVTYKPYYGNVEIKTDGVFAMSFTVEGGIVTDFTLNAFSATSSGVTARCYSAKWLLQSFLTDGEEVRIDDIALLYDTADADRFTGCEWNVKIEAEAEE